MITNLSRDRTAGGSHSANYIYTGVIIKRKYEKARGRSKTALPRMTACFRNNSRKNGFSMPKEGMKTGQISS